jgi:hypothetical protein
LPRIRVEALAAGPRPAIELQHEAADRGIGQKALYAARKRQGITMAKERAVHGRWLWMLAPAAEDDGERELALADAAPPSA